VRVTIVIPTPALPCGVFEYSSTLAKHLNSARMSPRLTATVLSGSHSDILSKLRSDNAAATDLLHMQFGYYLYPPEFLLQLLELSRHKGWPLLITMHGFRPDMDTHHNIIRQNRIPLLVHSNSMKQGLCRCGMSQGQVNVLAMPCPDPPPLSGHSKNRPPVSLPLSGHSKNRPPVSAVSIGYFGFMLPHKGLRELCLALGLLLPAFPDLQATILSARAPFGVSGEYASAIAHTLDEECLRDHINWRTAFLSEQQILAELASCTVIVLPYQEHTEIGVSYAACVALASGRPLITTKVSFFENLEGVAYQTASNHPAELARAIKAMLVDPTLQATFATQARSYAVRNSWTNAATTHQALYKRILASYRHVTGMATKDFRII
jgi:glycosyltransferase involved in cell wall biosynthesis